MNAVTSYLLLGRRALNRTSSPPALPGPVFLTLRLFTSVEIGVLHFHEYRGRIKKEKHGICDPTTALTITSLFRVASDTFTMANPMTESTLTLCQSRPKPYARVDVIPLPESTLTLCQSRPKPYARVDLNPMPESTLTLCQSRRYPPSQGLWIWPLSSRSETI
jgi:hypothetical protein